MRRLSVQLLLPILAVVTAVVLVAAFYWSRAFQRLYVQSLTERLEREARLAADALPWGASGADLDRLCAVHAREIGGRVTVVADDGRVVGESEEPSTSLENHGSRPEVAVARQRGAGVATRFSRTLGFDMLYVAVADRREHGLRFVRVAVPLRDLEAARSIVRRTLTYGLLAALLLGGASALGFSRRIAARIQRIEALSRAALAGAAEAAQPPREDELGALERHLVELGREMRARLAATEAERGKLEAVLRSMADGVVVLDAEGRMVLCNASAIEQLELPIDGEPAGAKLSLVCRASEVIALVGEALRQPGQVLQREITFPGRERNRVLSASAVTSAGPTEPFGAILVLHDLTRIRHFEAMRAEFVANVSHELRTPLTAIRGYAETLQSGALGDPRRAAEFVAVILRHCERLTRLIDDLLTLSDLELGRTELRARPLAVEEVVRGCVEVLRQKAEERGVAVRVEIAPGLPPVLADRDRLEQVLINLIDNGIKYSGPGSEVRVVARSAGDGVPLAVEIAVRDNGVGIPRKDVPRLTERFYRVDRARSRELGGTGLGLAIVKHIIQAHGGSLAIESALGLGTTVRVVLPGAAAGPSHDA
ncbi:MAG: PAS domain-containing protein [Deltaproteobacteria bacterium]|nr:PAS domain-containing protein [Deltaproteobacteria bacterium]